MGRQGTILVVDDNKSILKALELLLEKYFARTVMISSPNRIPTILREERIDLVLLDMNFSAGINNGNEGLFWLSRIKKTNPSLPVVLFTAYADIDLAVNAIKDGAADFIVKPWNNDKLISTLLSVYNLGRSKRKVKYLTEVSQGLSSSEAMFWGESEAMRRILIIFCEALAAGFLQWDPAGTSGQLCGRNRMEEVSYPENIGQLLYL